MIAKRYPVATPFYPLWLSPLPHRVADVALLVHIVFEDSGNLVEAAKRLRLGLGGTTNAEMPRREGSCGPTLFSSYRPNERAGTPAKLGCPGP